MNVSYDFDRIIEPFAACFTREAAQKILEIRADSETQVKFEEFADKANRGVLTECERAENGRLCAM